MGSPSRNPECGARVPARRSSVALDKHRFHARRMRRLHFARHVGVEANVRRRTIERLGDLEVGTSLVLRPCRKVEIAGEIRCQIAGDGVREQKLLCRDRAGGEDRERDAAGAPARERGRDVGIKVRDERAALIAVAPDQPLKRLQRFFLAVFVDPARELGGDFVDACVCTRQFLAHLGQRARNRGVLFVGAQKRAHARAGKRKQRFRHKALVGDCAFDIEKNGFHVSTSPRTRSARESSWFDKLTMTEQCNPSP